MVLGLKKLLRFSLLAVVIVVCATIGATDVNTLKVVPTIFAQQQPQKSMARLTGMDEVPAKHTNATGSFELQLIADGRLSNYVLNLTNISNVMLVQLYQGAKGTNGPVVAILYNSANNGAEINPSSEGRIFSNQFQGPLAGKYISDLMKLIDEGNVYINVHTKQNPQGEIRGQLIHS